MAPAPTAPAAASTAFWAAAAARISAAWGDLLAELRQLLSQLVHLGILTAAAAAVAAAAAA